MSFEFIEKKSLKDSAAEALSLEEERRPLACRVRRLAEHFLNSLFAPLPGLGKIGGWWSSPSRRRRHASRVRSPDRCLALFLVAFGMCSNASARPKVTISTEDNSTIRIPYDPPNETKTKWGVTGASGEQMGTNVLLHEVKIQEYSLAGGTPELVAETPQCIYDRNRQEIFSEAHLKVHAQQGRLFVEGDGFLMQQTNSSLVVSNHVHSIIEKPGTTNSPGGETVIYSQNCRFRSQTETLPGIAIYHGEVHLADPQMKLVCETLTADLPVNTPAESSQIHHLVAETGVVIDITSQGSEPIHATGQKAVYDSVVERGASNEWLELTGEPRAALSNGWMTADIFLMNRTTGILRGKNNVHLHYLSESPTNSYSATNSTLIASDVYSDQFEYNTVTRLTRFWSGVRLYDPRINLRCEWLETVLPASEPGITNHLENLVAETNVLIDFVDGNSTQTNHASGRKAVYHYAVAGSTTNEMVSLTGDPRITLTNGWMTADEILTDHAQGWVHGRGNQHSVYARVAGEPPELDTQIFSDESEFHNETGVSVYEGHVRAYDPEMNLRSPKLTLRFTKSDATGTNRLEKALAERGVIIDFSGKAFAPADVTNFPAFVSQMNQPKRPIERFVSSQLSPATRGLLSRYPSAGTSGLALTNALVEDLNRIVQSGAMYESNRFAGIDLSRETTALMQSQPKGADLMQLNRLLLLDAFRGELFRNQRGDATRGTGDTATYSHKTPGSDNDVVIELSGSPKLEKPGSTVTAEEKIVYDQAVGKLYLTGRPVFLTRMEGLSPKPLPGETEKPASKKKNQSP